ncbi:Cof subfamily protein (haloacid dehalogenase superfamily) [Enterococcus sp. PF1-24]|uniref:Cof-type HAD-IIB family hydrolase n=1 Tax=unclassified Enterococcus TaxID=2608891 RepID=UPI00247592F8|nr:MULTISPECIES: Cof-type HAD-IIB family hydrolase [unclassified Enterococcus]MDH6365248.1 Cof subfamily protein (haloacid dehalogenase superfamily) [Enterococcus sp. PFB1-1]MDH6402349.1 Cof subfamily protein (haloacid dehalogenase superfamily) [Enterococcus sp. PF1-24]
MKKLIAIDLDGTTLNNESKLTMKTKETLHKAIAAGHHVVIATGRPYRMSVNYYDELKLTTPMINFNGALVHVPHQKWSAEKEHQIQREIAFDILEQKETLQFDLLAAENKTSLYLNELSAYDSKLFSYAQDEQNLLSRKTMKVDPTSLLLKLKDQNTEPIENILTKKYGKDINISTWGGQTPILEIVAKGIQKAQGIAHISEQLGIKRQNVIAFGDEHNDLEMLQEAGWGVAMANGTERAKAAANDVTNLTNHQDGLADYLEKYLSL